jgi:CheY-like chemotaxis protein
MNMPLMNGTQCLEEIKKLPRLSKVPVYIYSTAADPLTVAQVKQMGATDFIVKPVSFKELTEILSRILHHHKSFSL